MEKSVKDKIEELVRAMRNAEYMSGATNEEKYREESTSLYLEFYRLLYLEK